MKRKSKKTTKTRSQKTTKTRLSKTKTRLPKTKKTPSKGMAPKYKDFCKLLSKYAPKDQEYSKKIYLDNNGTTIMCKDARKTFSKWLPCLNPASNSNISKKGKEIIEKAKKLILEHCHTNDKDYTVIFTSGATESNSFIIRSIAEAYGNKLNELKKMGNTTATIKGETLNLDKLKPHIIISEVEHKSILNCAECLEKNGIIELSKIRPTIYGNILTNQIKKEIKPNTCLISIMYANNETGTINNIKEIGSLAKKNNIPLHSDCVQMFAKYRINVPQNNIAAFSVSFHKLYGPKQFGLLVIKNDLISGYNLKALIHGSQQGGLRGGTENVAAVASSIVSMKYTFTNRKKKNDKMLQLRNLIIDRLEKKMPVCNYKKFKETTDKKKSPKTELVILGPPKERPSFYLPNTLLLSVVCHSKKFCNMKFRDKLDEKYNIMISIGSACLTGDKKASHVLEALKVPPIIKRGTLRISLSDCTTKKEVNYFVNSLLALLKKEKYI